MGAHPQMFDDDDPFLERVRGLAAELPNSASFRLTAPARDVAELGARG